MPERPVSDRLESYFAGRPDIVAAILFGSVARGQARPESDIDLGVLLTHEAVKRGIARSRLIADVMGVLQRNDVDVVILNRASPLLLHRVIRDGHVVYTADRKALAEFTIWAIQQYEDTKPLRELQRQRLQRRLVTAVRSGGAAP